MSLKVQESFRDALLNFSKYNSGLLPEQVVVYRNSALERKWPAIRETEVEALLKVMECFSVEGGEKYSPALTFLAIAARSPVRFFTDSDDYSRPLQNPVPGTVIDDPRLCGSSLGSFYLISQASTKGTAVPAHYVLLYANGKGDSAACIETLEQLTHMLCYMYFNIVGSIQLPAPAQLAKKITHFVSTAIHEQP